MNSYQSIIIKISKLRELKLDKATLKSLEGTLRDPETIRLIQKYTKEFIASKKGSWTISLLTASLVSLATVPPLLRNVIGTQQTINKYREELSELQIIAEEVNRERERYSLLEDNEIQLDKYILNSERVLYLPEVIRQAAAPNQIKLVSFRPTEDDQDSQFMDEAEEPENIYEDEQFNGEDFSYDEGMEPLDNEPNGEFVEDWSPDSTIEPAGKKKELIPLDYSLQLEGDYLRIVSFLRDIQGYQSLLGIRSVQFSSTGSASMDPYATNTSSTGSVMLNMIIQIPMLKE